LQLAGWGEVRTPTKTVLRNAACRKKKKALEETIFNRLFLFPEEPEQIENFPHSG
jgi:hypothetical protein